MRCHQTVRSSLMSDSNSLYSQLICQSIKSTTLKEVRKLMLETLDIIDVGKEYFQKRFKVFPRLWQSLVHHDLKKVGKVITTVETDPMHSLVEDQSRLCYFFSKVKRMNSMSF